MQTALLRLSLLTLLLTSPAYAIDFDDVDAQGGIIAVAADHYRLEGAVFNRDIPIYDFPALEPVFSVNYLDAGATAPNAIALNSANGESISIKFVVPGTTVAATTTSVQALFGDTEEDSILGEMRAYDADGVLVDSDTMFTPSSEAGILTVSADSIARVELSADLEGVVGDGAAVDNLTFATPVAISAVPALEIGAATLLGGLLGLAGIQRLRSRVG